MHIYVRGIGALIVCMLSLGFEGRSGAQAADLFEAAAVGETTRSASADMDASAAVARQRVVRLNLAALDEPPVVQNDTAAAADTTPATSLRIELFADTVGTFRREGLEPAFGGGSVWTGELTDGAAGAATLVVDGQKITGQVEIGGRIYRIHPLGNRLHRVEEVAPSRLPPPGPTIRPPGSPESRASPADRNAAQAKGLTTIDVLFAFTTRAQAASSGINSEINLAVSLSNKAYAASAVQIQLRLRDTIQVQSFDERRYTYGAILSDITNVKGSGSTAAGRAAFKEVRARRDKLGADLVVLIREGGEYCGLGWLLEQPSASLSDYGYSEVTRTCLSTYTAAHEMGHNMGLNHDRYVEPKAPASQYNFGYVNVGKRVQDIMAYDDRCFAAGVNCTPLNMFSNPRKRVRDAPFGIVQGRPGAADAARRLNETRAAIASFRATKSGAERERSDEVLESGVAAAR